MEDELKELMNLSDDELDLICRRYFLDTKSESFKFKILSYEAKRISETPVGFLGDHIFLKISVLPKKVEYTKQNKSTVEVVTFFVKCLPKFSEYVKGFNAFNKEIILYQFLIPRLQDITIGINKWAPNCFFTRKEKLLVMEDLSIKGFRLSKFDDGTLDFEHLSVALKTIARLHASSIIFEERTHISILHHYPGYLTENAYPKDSASIRKLGFDNAVEALVEMAKLIPKYYDEVHNKIDEELPMILKKIFDFCIPSTKYRNVVNHADLWSNNILFNYSENKSETKNGRFTVECDVHEDDLINSKSNENGKLNGSENENINGNANGSENENENENGNQIVDGDEHENKNQNEIDKETENQIENDNETEIENDNENENAKENENENEKENEDGSQLTTDEDEKTSESIAETERCSPVDARLVDFQLSRYAPPVLDVMTLIIITTNSDFRQKNREKLLEIYYDTLAKEIYRHEINIDEIITKEKYKECCDYFELAGLIESCLFSHLTLLPDDITKSLVNCVDNFEDFIKKSRVDICIKAFKTNDNYQYRMSDVLSQIIDTYILDK